MSGVFLGSRYGALSQIIYILMGLSGLPVFAGGAGGFSYIFAPSFGYVIGFVAAAFIVGKFLEDEKKPGFLKIFLSCLLGTAVIYVIGYPYLYLVLTKVSGATVTFQGLLKPAVLIFLPGDLVKIIIAAYAGRKMVPIIKR
jgi:biotin transport system substrate-specific component